MRNTIEEWFSLYDLDPPFDFMSSLDELMLVTNSVMEQQRPDLLCELVKEIKCKPWLVTVGGGIWCVATLLSCPDPSPSWVATTLSIVAHVDHENESLIVPADIHDDYSLLGPIARTCAGSDSEDEEFQTGLINLMYALVEDSPDTSVMAKKLGGITDTLVSYLWPVEDHLIDCYSKLLATLEILSDDMEISEHLVDAGIVGMLFFLLEFAVSSVQQIRNNPEKLSASRALGAEVDLSQFKAIKTSFKILDRLRSGSERACARIEDMNERELNLLQLALRECVEHTTTYLAGRRVLSRHYMRFEPSNFE
jgi:hypothetical protein